MITESTKTISFLLLLQFSLFFNTQTVFSQESESQEKNFKNTVKVNLTNPMIFGDKCYTIGYERIIGTHQSFEVNIGRFSFPKFVDINTDSITQLESDTKSKGFHLSGEYRFYLSKENKYNAPHGVYLGPYVTYNSYIRQILHSAITESYTGELSTDFSFRAINVGFQLGYQFILWKRVSLDMVLFGPGVGFYKIKSELSTNLGAEAEGELFEKINEALQEKIPGYSLVVPGSGERTGSYNTTGMGFRYVVMLGYRF
jgi:hypothetical protein